jgi:hypothetical protein
MRTLLLLQYLSFASRSGGQATPNSRPGLRQTPPKPPISNVVFVGPGEHCGELLPSCKNTSSCATYSDRTVCSPPYYCKTDPYRLRPKDLIGDCAWDINCPGTCVTYTAPGETKPNDCPSNAKRYLNRDFVIPPIACGANFSSCPPHKHCYIDPFTEYGKADKVGLCIEYPPCGGGGLPPPGYRRPQVPKVGACAVGGPKFVCEGDWACVGRIPGRCGGACDGGNICIPRHTGWPCGNGTACPFPLTCTPPPGKNNTAIAMGEGHCI